MRIDPNPVGQPVPESSRGGNQKNASASSSAGSSALGQDQAELSGAHTQVEALAAQAAQLPEVREERVHALRQAVQSGGYHVDAEKVADAIFTHLIAQPAA